MKIKKALCAYCPEKFINTFGFKGNALSGVWQTVVHLDDGENFGIGLGVQSVLWSDSEVFAAFGEDKSNKLMFDVTKYAAKLIEGAEFSSPKELIDSIFKPCYNYAKEITGMDVTETFVLNALVPVDFASWSLYCKEQGIDNFDGIYEGENKVDKLANIPLVTYSTPVSDVVQMAKMGVCIFKIKIGSDPDKDGNLDKMLRWDMNRMSEIHKALMDVSTEFTNGGKVVYYFDANGRYDTKDRLLRLVSHMEKCGILERTVLFEEPFSQSNEVDLSDLPVCFAADESAHSLKDVKHRIDLGYKAITLKPIAKTLSVTIDMANCARQNNVQCFCADLTVNPFMVEWNKNFASRLKPLHGMNVGVVESNGAQNYVNWDKMKSYLAVKTKDVNGSMYLLDDEFYKTSGGVFVTPKYYLDLIKEQNNV